VTEDFLSIHIETQGAQTLYRSRGHSNLHKVADFEQTLMASMNTFKERDIVFDLSEVSALDSVGALLISKAVRVAEEEARSLSLVGENSEVRKMLDMVEAHTHKQHDFEPKKQNCFYNIGAYIGENLQMLNTFLAFIAQLTITLMSSLYAWRNIRLKETFFEIYESGIKALPIIALTTFLIGVVVAYQSAEQLKIYGANIFIVDMLGISILRELAPMLAAIIVAGRSGSAYAAQIGVMKITEELDAMRTMGFDPYVFLVLPRMIALMIMMPLLIFFADFFGVLGGMLIAKIDLDITVSLFMDRFIEVVAIKHFWIGLIKGPFFAILIASIGIFRGLQVKNDTQSIGFNTTRAVVESIFAVIICDAFFSIIFTQLGF